MLAGRASLCLQGSHHRQTHSSHPASRATQVELGFTASKGGHNRAFGHQDFKRDFHFHTISTVEGIKPISTWLNERSKSIWETKKKMASSRFVLHLMIAAVEVTVQV